MSKKEKHRAVFMIKRENSYSIQKRKKLNPLNKTIDFQDKTYIYNTSIPSFSKGLKHFYLFDINKTNGHLLFWQNPECLISPKVMSMICKRKVIQQLTSNLTDTSFKVNLMMVFVGLVIGGLIGWIAGGFG